MTRGQLTESRHELKLSQLYIFCVVFAMDLRPAVGMGTLSIVIKPSIRRSLIMSTSQPGRPNTAIASQPARDAAPRRLIVTASVVIFAIRDWSLWALVREGPWGPPMRLVLGNESVTDAVDRTVDALLMWPDRARLLQLKAGWQEQQVQV